MAGSATAAKSKITLKGSAEIVAEFFGTNLYLCDVKYLPCVYISSFFLTDFGINRSVIHMFCDTFCPIDLVLEDSSIVD